MSKDSYKMKEIDYWLWLSLKDGMNAAKMAKLISAFGSARAIYEMGKTDFNGAMRLNARTVAALCDKSTDRLRQVREDCNRYDIRVMTIDSPYYPDNLRHIASPPQLLYVRSRQKYNLNEYMCMSVVGTRQASEYGIASATKISHDAAANGFVIVSGMALGIDSAAHRGALNAGGITVAVLGSGIEKPYPYANKELMQKIIETGMVFSEYPPYTKPERYHFPERNRIIAGISCGTLVAEAPERSGALITANYALDEGRDVFSIPGDITRAKSAGTNNLIKEGAYPVTSARDIALYYSCEYTEPEMTEKVPGKQDIYDDKLYAGCTDDEKKILSNLSIEPVNFDMLLAATGLTPDKLTSLITMLEIKGKVKTAPGKNFTLNTDR